MPPEIDIRDIRKESFPVQQPLSFELIREVVNSENPLAALEEICLPVPEKYSKTKQSIEPDNMGGCIDDRKRVASGFIVDTNNTYKNKKRIIEIKDYHLKLKFKPVNRDELTYRDKISSRPFPGGAVGVDQMVLHAALTAGLLQSQSFWFETDPQVFTRELINFLHPFSENIRSGFDIPVHIDNDHGELPVIRKKGKIIQKNVQKLVENGQGCGAAGSFFEIADYLLRLDGNEGIADDLAGHLGALREDNGMLSVDTEIKKQTARHLVLSAMEKSSSRLDIYAGVHNATGIVFSTGKHSINRALLQKQEPKEVFFRSDIYARESGTPMAVIADRTSQMFGVDIDPSRYGIAVNLATYNTLGQNEIPRYLVK